MKKNYIPTLFIAVLALGSTGCTDILMVESKTSPTSEYLYTSPEGLEKAIVGMYDMDRSPVLGDNSPVGIPCLMDACTDLCVFRGGTTASLFRLDNNNASTGYFLTYWQNYYKIRKLTLHDFATGFSLSDKFDWQ